MNKAFKILLFFIVSLALVWFLLSLVSFSDVVNSFSLVSFKIIVLAFVFYILANVFRMLRFNLLLKIPKWKLFGIVNRHNFFNNLLPMRLGELSLFYYLRKSRVEMSSAVSYFMLFRIFDMFSIILIFFFALLSLDVVPDSLSGVVYVLFWVFGLFILMFFSFRYFGKGYIYMVKLFGEVFGASRSKAFRKFVDFLYRAFFAFRKISYGQYFYLLFVSLLLWGCLHFANYLIIRELDMAIALPVIIIASSMTIFTNVLPIHGIAGFGTMESIWALVLFGFGFAKEFAISSAFVLHVFQVLFFVLLGIVGFLSVKRKN